MESNSAAWLAGFFDGEGSVGIYPRSFNRTKTIRYYVLVVSLAQSGDLGRLLLEECRAMYGGSVYANKPKQRLESNKQMWKWNVSADKAINFLTNIEPHSRIKIDQIKLAFEFQQLENKRFDNEDAQVLAKTIKELKQQ